LRFFYIILNLLFIFFLFLHPVFARLEEEPNNTKKESNTINSGDTISGHTGMETSYGLMGDIDIFCLTVKYPGKLTIYATVEKKFGSSSGNPSIKIDILNPDVVKAGEWKDPVTGKKASPVYNSDKTIKRIIAIRKPGKIYLKVDRYEVDAYYTFKVFYEDMGKPESKPLPSAIQEIEPNDRINQAMSLPLRQPVTGHTGNMGKYGLEGNSDYYAVEIPYPGKVTVFLTIEGIYGQEEKGEPSIKISIVNEKEMVSGSWKDPYTGEDVSSIFYKGNKGKSIFVKSSGKLFLRLDRYEANAKYTLIVIFYEFNEYQ